MAESSIARSLRLAREKRERQEAAEAAAAAAAAEKPAATREKPGLFSAFFNRAAVVDAAVEAAQREAQTTDSNN